MKKLTDLTNEHAREIYNMLPVGAMSFKATIFKVKELLTTYKFHDHDTKLSGHTWFKIFEFLKEKGYTIE